MEEYAKDNNLNPRNPSDWYSVRLSSFLATKVWLFSSLFILIYCAEGNQFDEVL